MSAILQVERFVRQEQSVSGRFDPGQLTRLAGYLAGGEGEILFSLAGSDATDRAGGQKRCIKCIISGWFLVTDPATLKPVRYQLAIESNLVVVKDESALPPLELETEDEDYIICGNEMNVMERIEEEILLDLPSALSRHPEPVGETVKSVARSAKARTASPGNERGASISPFARLAELKKK